MYTSPEEQNKPMPPVDWLWPDWVPYGQLTVLVGGGGVGKTTVAQDFIHRCVTEKPAPNGAPFFRRTNKSLFVGPYTEMQIVFRRFKQWNTDITHVSSFTSDPDPDSYIDLTRSLYRERLQELISEVKPDMVVLDDFFAFLPPPDTIGRYHEKLRKLQGLFSELKPDINEFPALFPPRNLDKEARHDVSRYLATLAELNQCAVLLIDPCSTHESMQDVKYLPSVTFARQVIGVQRDRSSRTAHLRVLKTFSLFPKPTTVEV